MSPRFLASLSAALYFTVSGMVDLSGAIFLKYTISHLKNQLLRTNFKLDNISILYNIIFAFASYFPLLAAIMPAAELDKVFKINNISLDEIFHKVSVNNSGCVMSSRIFFNSPCSNLLLTCCQKSN